MRAGWRSASSRLFTRLAVAFGGALLVSFGLAALNSVLPLRQTIRQEQFDDLHDSAEILLARVDGYLGERCADLRAMAALLADTRVDAGLGERLGRAQDEADAPWLLLAAVDGQGRPLALSRPGTHSGTLLPAAPAPSGPNTCAIAVRPEGRPLVLFEAGLGDPARGIRLLALLDWAPIEAMVRGAGIERAGPDNSAFLVLRDGRSGALLGGSWSHLAALENAAEPAPGSEGETQPVTLQDGSVFLLAHAGRSGTSQGLPPLRVTAVLNPSTALAKPDHRVSVLLLAAFIGVVLAGVVSYVISSDLVERLDRLREAASRLTAGDHAYRLDGADEGREDEVGTLTRQFAAMSKAIHRERASLEEAVARRTRELEQKNAALDHALRESRAGTRAKSEFLANVSHEIRTPLNGIIGMTALALDAELPPETRAHLTLVKRTADGMLSLVNDLLDFSRIESSQMRLEPIPFYLRPCVEEVVRTMAPRAEEKHLELGVRIADPIPDDLVGDPGRLRQVLVHLLGNAVKFTERGRVDLEVEPLGDGPGETTLRFTVRDTGIGIDREKQILILEPFTQADGSSTRRHGGVGLGLTIASELVALMHGRITVESEPGRGSAFTFNATFGRARAQAHASPGRPVALAGVRALVVDDDPVNRRLLQARLSSWGMRPQCARDAEEAMALLRSAAGSGDLYQVALLDRRMPRQDGFALAARIKQDAGLASMPIILLSSDGERGDALRCRSIGIAAYLIKPVKDADLKDALTTLLETPGATADRLVTRHALYEGRPRPPAIEAPAEESRAGAPKGPRPVPRREEPPAIDPVDLIGRVEGDRQLLAELVRAFLDTAPQQLRAIDAALERGEGSAIVRAANTLRGSIGTFGAVPAMQVLGRLEVLGGLGDLAAARQVRNELEKEMNRLVQALQPFATENDRCAS